MKKIVDCQFYPMHVGCGGCKSIEIDRNKTSVRCGLEIRDAVMENTIRIAYIIGVLFFRNKQILLSLSIAA